MRTKALIAMSVLGAALVTACGSSSSGSTPGGGGGGAGPDASDGGGAGDTDGGASAGGSSNGGKTGNGGSTSNGGASGSAGTSGSGGASSGGTQNGTPDAGTPDAAGSVDGGDAIVDGGSLGPTVTILHPGAGVDRVVNVSIYFHGSATDPTDGTLTGNALVWTDSLEGRFGTGDPVNWAPTKTGSHTITLRATDSLGYGATDSITFNITP